MKVVAVNDTNIIIDLYNIGLLDLFVGSDIELHTTDFVINELINDEQKQSVQKYIESGNLQVKQFSGEEMMSLFAFQSKQSSNVSVTDCSVWMYAQDNKYILLTGDGNLRRDAEQSGVSVRGVLFVFDFLIEKCLLSYALAIDKLNELLENNVRLPKSICATKLKDWKVLNGK